jgi:hypothetical protein
MFRRGDPLEDLLEWLAAGGCVFLGAGLPVVFLFLSSIARTVSRVTPENRRIEPAQVWLNLLPVFNLVWLPITVDRVAGSIRDECEDRGLDDDGISYTRFAGLTWLVLSVFSAPALLLAGELPCFAALFFPLAVIFWFAYWAQVASYAHRLKAAKYVPPADEGW